VSAERTDGDPIVRMCAHLLIWGPLVMAGVLTWGAGSPSAPMFFLVVATIALAIFFGLFLLRYDRRSWQSDASNPGSESTVSGDH